MQFANFQAITELKLDHKEGSFVHTVTGQRVSLRECWIVCAKYGNKRFDRDGEKWFLECSSPDALTGTSSEGKKRTCGAEIECSSCKPVLWLGVVGASTKTPYLLEVNASAAEKIASKLNSYAQSGFPPFDRRASIRTAKTEKSSSFTWTQVQVRFSGEQTSPDELKELLDLRAKIVAVMDTKGVMSVRQPRAALPSLGM